MKTTIAYERSRTYIPYPNSATRAQVVRRIVDGLLMGASGVGIGAMVLLFMAMA